jgi:capsular polysaccharide biosynthesis protein
MGAAGDPRMGSVGDPRMGPGDPRLGATDDPRPGPAEDPRPGVVADPAASRRAGAASARPVAAAAFGPNEPPGDLAGLFPARETGQPGPPTRSVIDLTRHERLVATSGEQPTQDVERSVPPGFPVELPQPSARREQLLLTAVSWLIVLFTTLLGALGGLTYSSVQSTTYTATSSVIVYPPANGSSTQNDPGAFASAYARVATESIVLQSALVDAGLSMSVDEARRHLNVSAPDGAALITIRASADNAADAAALANAAANGISSYAYEHRAETGYRISKFTPATPPTSGSQPHRAESVVIGALIGMAVGAGVVLMIHRSRRISSRPRS